MDPFWGPESGPKNGSGKWTQFWVRNLGLKMGPENGPILGSGIWAPKWVHFPDQKCKKIMKASAKMWGQESLRHLPWASIVFLLHVRPCHQTRADRTQETKGEQGNDQVSAGRVWLEVAFAHSAAGCFHAAALNSSGHSKWGWSKASGHNTGEPHSR